MIDTDPENISEIKMSLTSKIRIKRAVIISIKS